MDFARFCPPNVTPERAEELGYDAGRNIPTMTN